jgi:uncharacterized protein
MENKYDQLQKLDQLRQQGILTQAEFEREKQRLLSQTPPPPIYNTPPPPPKSNTMFSQPQEPTRSISDKNQNGTYAMALHLILFVPSIGWLITLVMWLAKKDESPLVRQHGAAIMNMFLSTLIYLFVFVMIVGFMGRSLEVNEDSDSTIWFFGGVGLLFIIYGLVTLIFIIVNAVRASNGEAASYPLAIRMLNTDLAKEALRVEDHLVD